MTSALGGLRVLDLSQGFAGALVSQLLADYGAEVIWVEPPGGSLLRREPAWRVWQRGKKSVVLDLSTEPGRARAQELADSSDVLLESFRPGVAERLGLGYDALAASNPGLIYTSITGFGRHGPFRDIPGYEALVMAKLGGFNQVSGAAPRPGPAFCSVPYCSFSASQTALQGTLAALFVRERSGIGQRVETSLVQGVAAHDPWDWFLRLAAERYPDAFQAAPPYSERGIPTQSFAFRLLVCLSKDGHWLQFSQTSPHLFEAFMRALELDWMWDDPEWSTAPEFDTEEQRERFWERMLEAARSKTLAEWQAIFEREPDVWAEVYRSARELLDHPQMQHNGHVTEAVDPEVGSIRQLAPMVRMSGTPGEIRAPAPQPGQHAAELRGSRRADAPAPLERDTLASSQPLEGLTLLDLGLFYAAPYGPAILADLGARVIKVEPLSGEPMRMMMGFPEAGAVKSLQGKESVAVDVHRPEGREIVERIARGVDVVMMSYRAGVAEKLGLDAASLRRLNPNVVYLHAPGYGIDGPCGRKPAFAPTIGAGAGIGRMNAGTSVPASGLDLPLDELKPMSIRLSNATQSPGNADGCAALGVATALLLGLLARERTGVSQDMLTSMLCTTGYALSQECFDYADRPERAKADPGLHGISALYRLYAAEAGWVFLAAPQEREWGRLARALLPDVDLAAAERFASAELRAAADAALVDVLTRVFRTRRAADWERVLLRADVGCVEVAEGPIARAIMDDPIARDAGFLAEVEHPSFGRHRRLGPLFELSRTPGQARPACLLGQHTEAVLRELGYGEAAITQLEADGVISRSSS
jgi:crotonobetainyl-CoA:carnitine CoA-transferase CaiB-like acyl-CoA transferase